MFCTREVLACWIFAGPNMVAGGCSNLTRVQLRALLHSHGQPTDGTEAALAQRVAAFMSDDSSSSRGVAGEKTQSESGPSASEAAALEAAGVDTELEAWQAATTCLHEQRATAKAAAATARAALHAHRVRHNEQSCPLLQLVGRAVVAAACSGGGRACVEARGRR